MKRIKKKVENLKIGDVFTDGNKVELVDIGLILVFVYLEGSGIRQFEKGKNVFLREGG